MFHLRQLQRSQDHQISRTSNFRQKLSPISSLGLARFVQSALDRRGLYEYDEG